MNELIWIGSRSRIYLKSALRNLKFAIIFGALLFALCYSADAQPVANVHRIGFLSPGPSSSVTDLEGFRRGLRELGYIEGKNISIEYRFGEGKPEGLPDLAAELVRSKVDIIVALGTATDAVQKATQTIPVVMATSGDPVARRLVASLARPGGNITGLNILAPELSGKWLELLKETIPGISRIAVLHNPSNPIAGLTLKEIQSAAGALGLQLQALEVRSANDIEPSFAAVKRQRSGALIPLRDPVTLTEKTRIMNLAAKNRLPVMYDDRDFVESGGLMSYGVNRADLFRRAATYVDKILKGTKPAELPVERPTTFELVINLKAAKQIGLTVPPNVLARADKVIR